MAGPEQRSVGVPAQDGTGIKQCLQQLSNTVTGSKQFQKEPCSVNDFPLQPCLPYSTWSSCTRRWFHEDHVGAGPGGSRSCATAEEQAPSEDANGMLKEDMIDVVLVRKQAFLCPGGGHCLCFPRLFAVHTSLKRSLCAKAAIGLVENGPASHPAQMETNLPRREYVFHLCKLPDFMGLTLL
ncbi:unnamed protein product [Rangifer tarandus platyrhynchus]|uniref:Uncharacterized protein n=1 Tax=Rangifer tarandus platyrhynchus TaxID=3082113 RepID=A0AC59ZX08_RANTA